MKHKYEANPYSNLVSDILYQDVQPLESDNILRYYRTEMCPSLTVGSQEVCSNREKCIHAHETSELRLETEFMDTDMLA